MAHKKPYSNIAIAACFGTFLEWYDFLTFASLAVVLSSIFFPFSDPNSGLLASLATFGIGMAIRPIGSAFFGSLGDRIGRKPVFIITITMMGLATVSIGFLPTYEQSGILAPTLLVILRLIQGLSAGGEIGGSAVYLTEHAGNKNRGFKTSFLQLMGPLGLLVSTLQITFLQQWLSAEEFQVWGWRIPFWISMPLLLVAFYIRRSLEETPVFLGTRNDTTMTESHLVNNFKNAEIRKRMFVIFFCISGSGAILFFCVQVYTSIFLKTAVKLPSDVVDKLCICATISLFPLTVFCGWLSDKFGRKLIILAGIILGAIFIIPTFHLFQILGNLYINSHIHRETIAIGIFLALIALTLSLSLVVGPQSAVLAELFPAKNRNSAATLSHNLAAGWIGGMLPITITWINHTWGNNIAGLWYPVSFLSIAALLSFFMLPETVTFDLTE